jgi:hypothetical protein
MTHAIYHYLSSLQNIDEKINLNECSSIIYSYFQKADKAVRNIINNPNSKLLSFLSFMGIHRNVDRYCKNPWNVKWRHTTEKKLREIKHPVLGL